MDSSPFTFEGIEAVSTWSKVTEMDVVEWGLSVTQGLLPLNQALSMAWSCFQEYYMSF